MFTSGYLASFAARTVTHKSPLWKLRRPIFVSSVSLDDRSDNQSSSQDSKGNNWPRKNKDDLKLAVTRKHKIFQDVDSPVILDIEEERQIQTLDTSYVPDTEIMKDEFSGLSLQRTFSTQ